MKSNSASSKHRSPRFWRWLGRHELAVLAFLALIVSGIWLFVEIADEVLEDETLWLDRTIMLAMRHAGDPADPWGPLWLEEMGRDFTALGGIGVLTFVSLTVIGYLLLDRKSKLALFVAAAVVGGVLLSSALKLGFGRPRPDLVPHASHVVTTSFPSGHAMMAAVTYLTLAGLLVRITARRRVKVYIVGVASLLTLLIGISRVYLGVHWPTDILAGWTAGATWAVLCWFGAWALQHRGKIETSEAEQPELLAPKK